MIVIVASANDMAAMNIKQILIKRYGFIADKEQFDGFPVYKKGNYRLVTINKNSVSADHLDRYFSPELYIFASRHASVSGMPCLTVHSTGNFGKNELGGNERELSFCHAIANRSALLHLEKNRLNGFEVCLEVTHHGPTNLKSPLLFVEVGSTEKEWKNLEACSVVADAIMKCSLGTGRSEIAFGGPHYAPKFTKLCIQGRNIGHICPKYYLDMLDEEMFRMMVERTVPRPDNVIIDKKGVKGKHKAMISKFAVMYDMGVEML
jgi:D-aminoacyl-tRNA deacylase